MSGPKEYWVCTSCTFHNKPRSFPKYCEMCRTPRDQYRDIVRIEGEDSKDEKERRLSLKDKDKDKGDKKDKDKDDKDKPAEDELPEIRDLLKPLCMKKKWSDVTFIVGTDEKETKRFSAHKVILAARSPVFAAMFFSQFAEATDTAPIRISDIEPTAFKQMLRFICEGLSVQTACNLLEELPAWMDEDTEQGELWKSVLKWMKHKVDEEGKFRDKSDEEKFCADLLKPIIPLIRFPVMASKDLAMSVAPTKLVPNEHLLKLFQYGALRSIWERQQEEKRRTAAPSLAVPGVAAFAALPVPSAVPTAEDDKDKEEKDKEKEKEDKGPELVGLPYSTKPREGAVNTDTSWMETTDSYRGFREIEGGGFWMAVSKSNSYVDFRAGKKYGVPKGYEWAKTQDWIDKYSTGPQIQNSRYNYYNEGGWAGYTWNGVERHCFVFADSLQTNRMVHAGNYASMSGLQYLDSSSSYQFAGLVCKKKGKPEASSPSSAAAQPTIRPHPHRRRWS